MENPQEQLRARTKQFAVRIIRLFRAFPRSEEGRIIGRQLLRCGTSVAANYRAAGRSRSRSEFVATIGTVVEEADETVFWLELAIEVGLVPLTASRTCFAKQMSCFESSRLLGKLRNPDESQIANHPIGRSPDLTEVSCPS